jgi:hypothetical protein
MVKSVEKKIASIVALLLLMVAGFCCSRKGQATTHQNAVLSPFVSVQDSSGNRAPNSTSGKPDAISLLTNEKTVIAYLREHHRLPPYYMTKDKARRQGWQPQKGNLCKVLPGKAIGGDYFGNREGKLPREKDRKYYEADINYSCGFRNADRLLYSNDGLIFVTKDHYRTFQKQ